MKTLIACLVIAMAMESAASEPRQPRVLFFHASWCVPCEQALKGPEAFPDWLRRSGWEVDESTRSHVQLVNVDDRNDLVTIYGVRRIPAMVLIDGVHSGPVMYTGRASLIGMFR